MRAAVIFLFVGFFLLTGSGSVCAKESCKAIYNPAVRAAAAPHYTEKQQQIKFWVQEIREDFISVENADDDFEFSSKQVWLARFFITLAYGSLLNDLYSWFKGLLPFCEHLSYSSSYKYILQRVLRI